VETKITHPLVVTVINDIKKRNRLIVKNPLLRHRPKIKIMNRAKRNGNRNFVEFCFFLFKRNSKLFIFFEKGDIEIK